MSGALTLVAPGELAYAEATADQANISAGVDLTGLQITFEVKDRPVLVMGRVPYWVASAVTTAVNLLLVDPTAAIFDYTASNYSVAANGTIVTPPVFERLTVPGTYTRRLQASRLGGSGTVTMKAAVGPPSWRPFIRATTA